jgi:gas vesicle protein
MPRTRPDDRDDDDDRLVIVEREDGGNVLGAFVLGAVVGAGLALLLAPGSGADTRRTIKAQARRATDATKRAAGGAAEKVGSAFAQARAELELRLETAKASLEGKREEVERAMAAGREAARQAREDVQRRIAEQRGADAPGARTNGDEPHAHGTGDTGRYADALDEAYDDLRPLDPGRGEG